MLAVARVRLGCSVLVAMREKQRQELERQALECTRLGANVCPKPLLQGLVSTLKNTSVLRAVKHADGSHLVTNVQKGKSRKLIAVVFIYTV